MDYEEPVPTLSKSNSAQKGIELKNQGNKLLNENRPVEAIKMYTEAMVSQKSSSFPFIFFIFLLEFAA